MLGTQQKITQKNWKTWYWWCLTCPTFFEAQIRVRGLKKSKFLQFPTPKFPEAMIPWTQKKHMSRRLSVKRTWKNPSFSPSVDVWARCINTSDIFIYPIMFIYHSLIGHSIVVDESRVIRPTKSSQCLPGWPWQWRFWDICLPSPRIGNCRHHQTAFQHGPKRRTSSSQNMNVLPDLTKIKSTQDKNEPSIIFKHVSF